MEEQPQPIVEVFVSQQNEEQNFLLELLRAMSNLMGHQSVSQEQISNLVDTIFQEFINIHPERISPESGIIIRWSIELPDEEGIKRPMSYEISFSPFDVQTGLSKRKNKIRETTEHLATYRKVKADDPLIESKESCSICYDIYQVGQFKRVLEKCNHTFHKKCVDKWFVSHPNLECPLCRANYNKLDE